MNQRKCPSCGHWNEGSGNYCSHCGALIDEKIIREEQKKRLPQAEIAQRLKEQPDWLNRFFEKLRNSGNPFGMGLYYVLNALWMVYFSILLGIVWLVVTVAG